MTRNELTRSRLLAHARVYPDLRIEDIFKFLFQSALGCEHLVASEARAVAYIRQELTAQSDAPSAAQSAAPRTEGLDGDYCRVHFSWLQEGLRPETLGRLFCRSAKTEPAGRKALIQKLAVAQEMLREGLLPFTSEAFDCELALWREQDYPAIHHSEAFRNAYRPAYRVVAREYAELLPLLIRIDRKVTEGKPFVLAIEGGSAAGKTTLAALLSELYDCNIFHADDFFLRPEQRTPARLAEIGGNLDRERLLEEVLTPTRRGETVCYRPFDCSTQSLGEAVTVPPKTMTVVEGAYSMHPLLEPCYDLSVLLDIDPAYQRERILHRNSPAFAKRFFEEWIPMEERYKAHTRVRERCDVVIRIGDGDA